MTNQEYGELVNDKSKPSPMWKNLIWAFVVGGGICCIGQAFQEFYQYLGMTWEDAGTTATITLIFASALFTGLDLYEKLAKHAGAGTLVPVTGFANSIVAPAMEFKSDESAIIYPSQTNLHNSWGEYDSVQNKIGRRRGNHSELTIKLKLPHEGVG